VPAVRLLRGAVGGAGAVLGVARQLERGVGLRLGLSQHPGVGAQRTAGLLVAALDLRQVLGHLAGLVPPLVGGRAVPAAVVRERPQAGRLLAQRPGGVGVPLADALDLVRISRDRVTAPQRRPVVRPALTSPAGVEGGGQLRVDVAVGGDGRVRHVREVLHVLDHVLAADLPAVGELLERAGQSPVADGGARVVSQVPGAPELARQRVQGRRGVLQRREVAPQRVARHVDPPGSSSSRSVPRPAPRSVVVHRPASPATPGG
jgi:hypothetical protein